MNNVVFLNGQYVPMEKAVVPVEDRGYQFADGVYDVVKFFGHKPLRFREHLDRIAHSCEGMRFEGYPGSDEWLSIVSRLLRECEVPDDMEQTTILYQQVTRGVAPRNHLFPSGLRPTVLAYFKKCPTYSDEQRNNGVSLSTQPDERWARCNIKSICLLPAIWAKQAAHQAGAFEALLVRDGVVTEGSSTNAFCVLDGVVFTHPCGGHILPGVTRTLALEAAAAAGMSVRQECVPVERFLAADEVFLTSTTMNLMPVTSIDGRKVGNGLVGALSRKLAAAMDSIVARDIKLSATVASGLA